MIDDARRYQEAKQTDTTAAYYAYLGEHPYGKYSATAREKIREIARAYLQQVKAVHLVIEDPFDTAESMIMKGDTMRMAMAPPEKTEQYKTLLFKNIDEVVRAAGFAQGDSAARLIVNYDDEHTSGITSSGGEYQAYKSYKLTLRLADESGSTVRREEYQSVVETTAPNAPFAFEKVIASVRENVASFFK